MNEKVYKHVKESNDLVRIPKTELDTASYFTTDKNPLLQEDRTLRKSKSETNFELRNKLL